MVIVIIIIIIIIIPQLLFCPQTTTPPQFHAVTNTRVKSKSVCVSLLNSGSSRPLPAWRWRSFQEVTELIGQAFLCLQNLTNRACDFWKWHPRDEWTRGKVVLKRDLIYKCMNIWAWNLKVRLPDDSVRGAADQAILQSRRRGLEWQSH